MKDIVLSFKNMQAFSFLIGMVWGGALGLILFCLLVPHGPKAIAMLRHYTAHMSGARIAEQKNREDFALLYASSGAQMPIDHSTSSFSMNPIISEEQFLNEMKSNNESAVIMARQTLQLKSLRPEVKDMANDIIATQTTEIKIIKDWLATWK